MTPQAALTELLTRVGAAKGAAVLVGDGELRQWPAAAVAAMKSQKLLARARPAMSLVCPGCEQECVMPVHTVPAASVAATSFIVCDKRSDINRVPVSVDRLGQWRCDTDAVVGFIAARLGLRRSNQGPAEVDVMNIGMASGKKRSQMLSLRVDDGELCVVAATNTLPLAELVGYDDGEYSVDDIMVRRLVDSATTADSRYTPSSARREATKLDTQARYACWRKEYRALKKKRPNRSDVWCARQIAKQGIAVGRSPETIRKHMKK